MGDIVIFQTDWQNVRAELTAIQQCAENLWEKQVG